MATPHDASVWSTSCLRFTVSLVFFFSLLILTFPSSCPMCAHGYLETLSPLLFKHPGVLSGYLQYLDGFPIRKWRCMHGEAEQ